MQRRWNLLINKIHHGDCLEVMKDIPDGSVNLVVTDPPYGINFNSNYRKHSELKSVGGILNDGTENISFLRSVANEIFRVLRNDSHLYWFTRWDKVDEQKPMLSDLGFDVKNNIIWVKNNWSMGDLKGSYASQYECILFCNKGAHNLNGVNGRSRHSDIINFDRVPSNNLLHSHEKPIALIDFLIKKSSQKGDTVLDPFLGSGTTAVAAYNADRSYIGIELDNDYYEIANKRINETMAQTNIFDFI